MTKPKARVSRPTVFQCEKCEHGVVFLPPKQEKIFGTGNNKVCVDYADLPFAMMENNPNYSIVNADPKASTRYVNCAVFEARTTFK